MTAIDTIDTVNQIDQLAWHQVTIVASAGYSANHIVHI
jgi:hypothetical protein